MGTRGSADGPAGVVVSQDAVVGELRDWQRVVELMADTGRDFERMRAAVLPTAVQPKGSAFAVAWARYASESAARAGEVVGALEETLRDFDVTDGRAAEQLGGFMVACAVDPQPVPGPEARSSTGSGLASRLGPLP
ncbi:hypothetical protein [Nocardioides campestrisoli]|uniref:hypothetical protein n=1 Tax=Nocardioides campestrisoli TaxID=2736757 RepID=UPI0015E6716F|nr:hypothetical protein [Nocardioides campestrisoli]